jgi:predicted DNA-binding transcriptional regulator YafY
MNHPAGRVLTLLELLQSGGLRTAPELADRLGVDVRTVRRYVDHLLDLDIPVESVRGRYGGYRLARGFRLPPLMLGDDEALAVLLGLLAGRRSGLTTALGPAGETAAAKIRRVLPARLADRLQGVLDSIAFTGGPAPGQDAALDARDTTDATDATVLLTVADAVAEHRPIAVGYTDRDGVRSERTLHPHAIVSHRDRWYLRALDPAVGQELTFRLDRIGSARTAPGSFEPPARDEKPEQALLTGFATANYRYEVTLHVQGTVEQIRRRFPASVATIQPLDGDGDRDGEAGPEWHRLDIRAERLDWLPPTLAALDLPFEIQRPDELRDRVLALAERLASRARGEPE